MQQLSLFSANDADNSFNQICSTLCCENNTPAWTDRFGEAMSQWININEIAPIRTLSLFSGAGGLDIGFADAGFQIVNSVELEKKFCETLELNSGTGKTFSDSKVICIDIREFSGKNLKNIDFIIGGPPCQTFSAAGRRANGVLGTTDSRGMLFKEYVRLLKEISPKGFLFENVYGIIGAQGGENWRKITKEFSKAGYKLFYRILDAADYGVPQHRERVIIVGLKNGEFKFPRPTHGPDSPDAAPFYIPSTAIKGVIKSEPIESNRLSGRFAPLLDDIPPGLNYSFYTEKMGHPNPIFAWRSKFSDFLYKADPDTPVRTIKASGGAYTGPLHWDNRFFTLEEYKRLQTFPDNYSISGNKQTAVKQIGNSVPPQLARILAIAIRQQVFGTVFPFELPLLEANEQLTFRKRKRQLTEIYRKKAADAIETIKTKKNPLPDSYSFYCYLGSDFKLIEADKFNSEFRIEVIWEKKLEIIVTDNSKNSNSEATVIINASDNKWVLNADSVELHIKSEKETAFTTAWKVFERELIRNNIKADLVQLNGYYKYPPKLKCKYITNRNTPFEEVLKNVVEGNCIARIIDTEELAAEWKLSASQVMDTAQHFKNIGYEIRNNSTNPQINEGEWLIPYAFPTLTHLSVQLRKRL